MAFDIQAFLEAHSRYQGFRDAAFHATWACVSRLVPQGNLRVMPINREALSFWQAVRSFGFLDPRGGFPWDRIYDQLISTPRRFDVAIWSGSLLCGMAAGKASRGDENVTIKWMERFPIPDDPLKSWVATTAFTAADHYAKILGRQYLMIRNPLPGTQALYQAHRFVLAPARHGATYYARAVA